MFSYDLQYVVGFVVARVSGHDVRGLVRLAKFRTLILKSLFVSQIGLQQRALASCQLGVLRTKLSENTG